MDDAFVELSSLRIAIAELELASGLTRAEIVELVEYGALAPQGASVAEWTFPGAALALLRGVARLRSDFDLAPAGLALLLAYRERIAELEARLCELACRLPR